MREFIKDWWWLIVMFVIMDGVLALVVSVSSRDNRMNSLCVQNGYADWIQVPNVGYFCYRVADGNLVTIAVEALESDNGK